MVSIKIQIDTLRLIFIFFFIDSVFPISAKHNSGGKYIFTQKGKVKCLLRV